MKLIASIALVALLGPELRAQDAAQTTPEPLAKDARIAGQDAPVPSRKKYVAPEYPATAAAQGIRGIVILEVLIGENGGVLNARVTRSIPGLDEAALAAVKQWEYEPTRVDGKPVKIILAQSITFALKLPTLQRALGVPELKSGGAPPMPTGLASPAQASVEVRLGPQGEVAEASVLDGPPLLGEALLRAVKSWRFVLPEGSNPPSFTVRSEWTPGPPPALTLSALDPRAGPAPTTDTAPAATTAPPAVGAAGAGTTPVSPVSGPQAGPPPPSPEVPTEVLPARPEPPAKEAGTSAVSDVVLGENIPDLVRGRRPTWPPLARLGAVTGEVVVRFSVDLAGKVTVHSAEGPDMLKAAAEQAVGTWLFRRTAIDRLHLVATFKFAADRTMANVAREP